MKNKKLIIFLSLGLVLAVAAWLVFGRSRQQVENDVLATVKKGDLEFNVSASGELEPLNSTEVRGPAFIQRYGIYQIKIGSLVNEGTVVKKDELIAKLDMTDVASKLREAESEMLKVDAQYIQTQLDTSLTLRQSRDEIINKRFEVNEKEIVLAQSKFEPPATIRQAELDVEKTKRSLKQAEQNYRIKVKQQAAKMQEVAATLSSVKAKVQGIQDLMAQLTIKAPEPGMVIYRKDWNGRKVQTGSMVSAWDPVVAKLPDLSVMMSKTYINETDIRQVQVGQTVQVGLDAFPSKRLTGKIVAVANMGEQRPNTDSKVYEVQIKINEADTSLRPGMTTSNRIATGVANKVLYVPLESLHAQGDSLTYVYCRRNGSLLRQEVLAGRNNENHIEILHGLAEHEQVLLNKPGSDEGLQLVMLDKKLKEKPKLPAAPDKPLAQKTASSGGGNIIIIE